MESARLIVPDRDAVTDVESVGIDQRDLFLAVIAIQSQRRRCRVGFAKDRPALASAHRDEGTEVQRIVHEKFAFTDFNNAPAQTRDVIHSRLQRAIVRADDVRIAKPDGDAWAHDHFGMHGAGQLLLLRSGSQVRFLSRDDQKSSEAEARKQQSPGPAKPLQTEGRSRIDTKGV